jgi:hypothetical protein
MRAVLAVCDEGNELIVAISGHLVFLSLWLLTQNTMR